MFASPHRIVGSSLFAVIMDYVRHSARLQSKSIGFMNRRSALSLAIMLCISDPYLAWSQTLTPKEFLQAVYEHYMGQGDGIDWSNAANVETYLAPDTALIVKKALSKNPDLLADDDFLIGLRGGTLKTLAIEVGKKSVDGSINAEVSFVNSDADGTNHVILQLRWFTTRWKIYDVCTDDTGWLRESLLKDRKSECKTLK